MSFSWKTASAKFTLSIILLSFATCASAGPKEDVAAAASTWAAALGEDEPDKVLHSILTTPCSGGRCLPRCVPIDRHCEIIS